MEDPLERDQFLLYVSNGLHPRALHGAAHLPVKGSGRAPGLRPRDHPIVVPAPELIQDVVEQRFSGALFSEIRMDVDCAELGPGADERGLFRAGGGEPDDVEVLVQGGYVDAWPGRLETVLPVCGKIGFCLGGGEAGRNEPFVGGLPAFEVEFDDAGDVVGRDVAEDEGGFHGCRGVRCLMDGYCRGDLFEGGPRGGTLAEFNGVAPGRAARRNGCAILVCLNELASLARLRAERRPGVGATTDEQIACQERGGVHGWTTGGDDADGFGAEDAPGASR